MICVECKKNKLVGYNCKCNMYVCIKDRDKHSKLCLFDYIKHNQEILTQNLPKCYKPQLE